MEADSPLFLGLYLLLGGLILYRIATIILLIKKNRKGEEKQSDVNEKQVDNTK